MFIHKIEKDKYENEQTHYWLTQGDSCGIISTPKNEDGTLVNISLISNCKFKLYDYNTNVIIYQKEMTLNDNKFLFKFDSTESAIIKDGKYKYEIEYNFIDGSVNTTNQWVFEIIPQAIENIGG